MKYYKERTERIQGMKKKIIIISSIIVCLLIVGGITFVALNKTSKDKKSDVTESLEAETSTDADKESDVSTDKEKDDTSTNKKETNTVESDKKEDEKKTDDKTTEEQKTEDKKTDNNKTDNKKTEADKKTTENTGSNSESTKKEEEHKHTWVTGYRTEGCDCGAQFTDHAAAMDHLRATEHMSGLVSDKTDGWDEVVETQVPHTTTVVDQAAWDETVVEKIEYTYCSECGTEK